MITPGQAPLPPHRSLLPESELPPGTTLSGVLVFDVPRAATVGGLAYGGSDRATEITLPTEERAAVPPVDTPGSPTTSPSHAADHGSTTVTPRP